MAIENGVGAAPLRKEDLRFLTGRGTYVADLKRPDMAFAPCATALTMFW